MDRINLEMDLCSCAAGNIKGNDVYSAYEIFNSPSMRAPEEISRRRTVCVDSRFN